MHVLRNRTLFRKAPFPSPRSVTFLVASILCVVAFAVAATHKQASETANALAAHPAASAAPAATDNDQPAPTEPSAASSPATHAASGSTSPVPGSTNSAHPVAASSNCELDLDSLTKEYQADMQKARDDLDSKLSFPVGLSITSLYVDNYNKQVSDMYDQYGSRAAKAGCSFQLAKPAPLPETYVGQ